MGAHGRVGSILKQLVRAEDCAKGAVHWFEEVSLSVCSCNNNTCTFFFLQFPILFGIFSLLLKCVCVILTQIPNACVCGV